jgi:hypothetical protein
MLDIVARAPLGRIESFERIHRPNLVDIGVLTFEFLPGQSAASLGLTGREIFDIEGIAAMSSEAASPAGAGPCRWSRVRRTGRDRHAVGEGLPPQRHPSYVLRHETRVEGSP